MRRLDSSSEGTCTEKAPADSESTEDDAKIQNIDQTGVTGCSTVGDDSASAAVSPDLWSAAYREAVESLEGDIDIAILKGKGISQLFKELEALDKGSTEESAFRRGVVYLRSLQVPLEKFKLALDLASPLTSADLATGQVFGLVRGVTAVSCFPGTSRA